MQFLFYITGPSYYPHQKMRLQVCLFVLNEYPEFLADFPHSSFKNVNHMPNTTVLIILLIVEQSLIEFKGLSNS